MKFLKANYKKLYKYYKARLKQKMSTENFLHTGGLEQFILYLQLLRDLVILSGDGLVNLEQVWFKNLQSALVTFSLYADSLQEATNLARSKAEKLQFLEDSQKYWFDFWTIIANNLESWVSLGDTLI